MRPNSDHRIQIYNKKSIDIFSMASNISDKVSQLLGQPPPISPTVATIQSMSDKPIKDCCICGHILENDGDKLYINVFGKETRSGSKVVEVITDLVDWDKDTCSGIMCNTCLVIVDNFDILKKEIDRIRTEMVEMFNIARKQREIRFLWLSGDGSHVPEGFKVTLYLVSGNKTFTEEIKDPVLISRDSPLLVSSLLQTSNLFLDRQNLMNLQIYQDEDTKVISYQDLLQLGPFFSLSEDSSQLDIHTSNARTIKNNQVKEHQEQMLSCLHCDFHTKFFHLLVPHLKTHHPDQTLSEVVVSDGVKKSCEQCGKIFLKSEVLDAHIKKVHQGNETPWECQLCGKGFTRKASLEEHLSRHQGSKQKYCRHCDKHFYDTAYWRHVTTVHPVKAKLNHACSQCDKVFSQRFKLDLHLQCHMDNNDKKFACEDCPDKKFASSEKLRNHRRSVHDKKVPGPLLCGVCGNTFTTFSSLHQHNQQVHEMEKATEEKSTQSFICGFRDCLLEFQSIHNLQQHQMDRHKDELHEEDQDEENVIFMGDINDDDDEDPLKESDIRKVSINDDELPSIPSFSNDNQFSHTMDDDFCKNNRYIFAPEDCNIKVPSKKENDDGIVNIDFSEENTIVLSEHQGKELIEALNIEMRNSSNNYPCSLCDKVYKNEKGRSIHIKSVNLQEKPFVCPECNKSFACKNYLTEHQKIHTSQNMFKCNLCDRHFSSNKVLKRHFRVHTGEKPFKCEYCEKRFAAASNLSEHRTLHTGRLPYTCNGCGKKFRLWTTLKKHLVKCEGSPVCIKVEEKVGLVLEKEVDEATHNLDKGESFFNIMS